MQNHGVRWEVVHAKQQRRLCNEITKDLIGRLDQLLPSSFKAVRRRKGAGRPSFDGRALIDVLEDVRNYVQHIRVQTSPCTVQASAARLPDEAAADMSGEEEDREVDVAAVLASGHDLLCLEVEMGGEQDWVIRRANEGAGCLWSKEAWGGSAVGSSLCHLVHRQDVDQLWALHRQCRNRDRAPARAPETWTSSTTIRFVNFAMVPCSSHRLPTCRYRSYRTHIHPLSSRRSDTEEHRLLIVGCPLTPKLATAEGRKSKHTSLEELFAADNLDRINGRYDRPTVELKGGHVISPGMLRTFCYGGVAQVTTDELSFLQRISGIKTWCMQTWTDWCYRFLQYNNEIVLDDDGWPR